MPVLRPLFHFAAVRLVAARMLLRGMVALVVTVPVELVPHDCADGKPVRRPGRELSHPSSWVPVRAGRRISSILKSKWAPTVQWPRTRIASKTRTGYNHGRHRRLGRGHCDWRDYDSSSLPLGATNFKRAPPFEGAAKVGSSTRAEG